VTVFYGILNTLTGEVDYVNAGHNPPYLISPAGIRKVDMTGGLILGCMEGLTYQSKTIKLNPGDRLFLYTDGVTEAFNTKDEAYGEDRLEAFLKQNAGSPIDEVVKKSFTEINDFSAGVPQSDDITLLSIVYHGTN